MSLGSSTSFFLGAGAGAVTPPTPGGYTIERSLRFNSADSAYLNRTPSSAGNRKTWTWAGWVKRTAIGASQQIFGGNQSANPYTILSFMSDDTIRLLDSPSGNQYNTQAVFRDPSSWYHIVFTCDTTQSTAADRFKIYVNGTESPLTVASAFAQDYSTQINTTTEHRIGRWLLTSNLYLDGYLADVHFIDGQALDPTSFGEFDDNGVWQPIEYAGSYGTNGFHLDFSDNSTAAALGTDTSGNDNDWTVNNLVPNEGVTYSSYVTGYLNSLFDTATYPVTNLFDGSTSTIVFSSSVSGSGIKFVPPTAITGSIELYLRNGDTANSTFSYSLDNGSSFTNLTTTGGDGSYVSIGSQTIDTTNGIIVRHVTTAGSNRVNWRAIRLDGAVLTDGDPSSIDSLFDSPTNGTETDTGLGGQVRGNYCTLNPLDKGGGTLSNGNLDFAHSSASYVVARSTVAFPSSGKWYVEVTMGSNLGATIVVILGIATSQASLTSHLGSETYSYAYGSFDGKKLNNQSTWNGTAYGDSFTNGDVIGIAFDSDSGSLYFYKNGIAQDGGTAAYTGLTTATYFPAVSMYGGGGACTVNVNFGQRPFAYSAPTGFKALCTANLDDPTIADGSTAMDVALYTGNGSTQTISGLDFSPDFVWIKSRSGADNHAIQDAVRGATYVLQSNTTNAEVNASNTVGSFTSDGFTLAGNAGSTNGSSVTYAAWTWDAGTTTDTNNTAGSITPTGVRANASAGFSIVKYALSGSSNETIGHGLNSSLGMLWTKALGTTNGWACWHSSIGDTEGLVLSSTAAASSVTWWDQSNMTSSVFAHKAGTTSPQGGDIIAYCFAPVEGYSAFGSYTGNGSTDGPFVYTGFRPRWLMFKRSDVANSWMIYDAARNEFNVIDNLLKADSSNAETSVSGSDLLDFTSNGFKIREDNAGMNASGGTYVYACFSEHPFKTARAR